MAARGQVEHYLVILGGLALFIIEAKYILGKAQEHLDTIAQVIAECESM